MLRAHDFDLGFDRRGRAGELRGCQDGHRRAVQVNCLGHVEVQCALQLHRAVRLQPNDRVNAHGYASSAGTGGSPQGDDAREDRSFGGMFGERSCGRHYGTDFCRT
ncbi:hypothetical protein D9M72_557910 [compost metagenome]